MSDRKQGFFARLAAGLRRSSDKVTASITHVFTKKETRRRDHRGAGGGADTAPTSAAGRNPPSPPRSPNSAMTADITGDDLRAMLAAEIERILNEPALPAPYSDAKPYVSLSSRVNGAGKTTTIGKIARALKAQDLSVALAAGDTFRAAAIEQLTTVGQRAGRAGPCSARKGSDAAALAFEALQGRQSRRHGRSPDRHRRALQNKQA